MCKLPVHDSRQSWFIGGKTFTGAIRSLYIWNYAKSINVMNYSPSLGLQYPY